MKLKEHIENFEKSLLKEVTATGATGTFVGGAGDYIDNKFSGGFHPDFMELKILLMKQVEGDIEKRMYSDDNTPLPDQDFIDLDWEYEYDKNEPLYDEDDFINKSKTNMKNIGIEYKYDINEPLYDEDNFINKSATNWKYIK
jgi:hypothetical protein